MNYYKILQVDSEAEPEVIAAAYKRLALKYHPDTNKSPNALKRMQEINIAYTILSDPEKRKLYDAEYNREMREKKASGFEHSYSSTKYNEKSAKNKNKELLHHSDFYSNHWLEKKGDNYRYYRLNGYYHIMVNHPRMHYYCPGFDCDNFLINVDAQFIFNAGVASYGLIICLNECYGSKNFYLFSISHSCFMHLNIVTMMNINTF